MLSAAVFLVFGLLPLDDVLPDERLVLDENDDPSEIIEFGRCTTFVFSDIVVENEVRSFGAVIRKCIRLVLYQMKSKNNIIGIHFTFF